MTWWQGVILGLVQGLTEFLPVSSSGHLRVVEVLTGVKAPGVFVEVSLHVATLFAVLVVYGARLGSIVRGMLTGDRASLRRVWLLIVATIPAAILGVLFHKQVEEAATSLWFIGICFIVTGLALWSTKGRSGVRQEPAFGGAVGIGLAQSVSALFRGISRSGSTVVAALWVGLEPTAAAEFSFLLSIPIIAGAALVEGRHATVDIAAVGAGSLALSFVVAFVAGIFSIRFLVAMLKRGRFYLFAPYCWAAGLFAIAYGLWHP